MAFPFLHAAHSAASLSGSGEYSAGSSATAPIIVSIEFRANGDLLDAIGLALAVEMFLPGAVLLTVDAAHELSSLELGAASL